MQQAAPDQPLDHEKASGSAFLPQPAPFAHFLQQAKQQAHWRGLQPSYYHFHIHFSHTKHFGHGLLAGKAHLLSDIIGALGLEVTKASAMVLSNPSCCYTRQNEVSLISQHGLFWDTAKVDAVDADNIAAIAPDYYSKRTLTFALGERDPLHEAFRKRKAATLDAETKAAG